MKPRGTLLAVSFGAAALIGGVAFAQPHPPGFPNPPGLPQGYPMLPGATRPGVPGMPGGRVPPLQYPALRRPPPQAEEHEEGGHHEEHCPGHGPMDPPPPPNWWHGLIGVNNEAAQSGSAIKRLLFRYENEHDPCDPKNEPPPFLASVINFAVLAFVIGKFGKKPVAAALIKRKESIMQEIDNATRLREEAAARLEEYEDKFEHIEEKLASAKAEYAAEAEQEKQRILLEAEERRSRMRRDAEFRIEQELKEARRALLDEAVEGAVRAAETLLAGRVLEKDQERIAEEYLAAVGKAAAGPAARGEGGRA